ncbi:hypothetical protein G7K_4278-t1 [Saitoella complicata NRRL Y-17804]|uniref:Uncharacterized protein n=1 Tax=Saitoella complicata (strain BCRC 22490 / CBS 7301 / JCM 7358 / NBRC 10748 / NRRL Y-17804) TaxID=698492 RepID=A0A0E9NK11_SAICN|nr:hypothetical protein G7K_4278-t1 [Saitoella complicata NRRL Y-17804]
MTPTHYSPGRPIHPRGRTASGSRFSEQDDDDDVAAHAPLNPHPVLGGQGEAYEFTEYPIRASGSRGGIGFEQRPSYVSQPSQLSQVDIGLGPGHGHGHGDAYEQAQTYSSHSYDGTAYDPEPVHGTKEQLTSPINVTGEGQSIQDSDRHTHGFGHHHHHHHDPNLPPRSRDIAHDHPTGPRPWWNLWSVTPMTATLFLMLVLLMAGLITAIGQDLFYQYLDGHDVISSSTSDTSTMSTVLNPASLPQIWINRTSQLFIFLYKTLLVASIALAFDQVFWYTVRSTAISIGEIDALWNLTSNPVYLFHFRTLLSGKLAAVLAVVSWMLPLSAIFNGGALTLRTTFDPSTSIADLRTLSLNGSQGYVDFSENWLEKQPSGVLARYAMRAMVGGSVVPPETVGGCTGNCSYELGFWGPGYQCAEATACRSLSEDTQDADYWAEESTDTGVYEFWVQSTSYNFCVQCVLYNTTYNISYIYTDGVPNVTISTFLSTEQEGQGALDARLEEEYVRVVASSAMSADVTYATPTFVVPTSAFLGSSGSGVRSGSSTRRGSVASGSASASESVGSGSASASASASASVGSVTASGSASEASATSAANSASGTESAASASASAAASGTSGTATQTTTGTDTTGTGTITDTGTVTSPSDTGTTAVTDTATTSLGTTTTDTGSSSAAVAVTTPTSTDSVATTTAAVVATTTPATTAAAAITSDTVVAAVTTPAVAVTTAVTTTATTSAVAAARKKRHLEIQNFRRGLLAKRTSEVEFLQGINSTLWSFFNTIGIKDTFVNALSGSIVPTNGSTTTVNNTAIANTNLATLAVIGGHNYLTFPGDVNAFMTGLEQLMQNITVSTLAMPAQDGSDPVMQQTTITSRDVRTVYSYSPHNRGIFWMSYGLGLFFASLCVAVGAYCLHKNHSVGSRNFSQVVVSTRNPTLDDVVLEGAATGTLPKTKVQLGRLAGAVGSRPVSQIFPMFGLKEEIMRGEGEKTRTQSA